MPFPKPLEKVVDEPEPVDNKESKSKPKPPKRGKKKPGRKQFVSEPSQPSEPSKPKAKEYGSYKAGEYQATYKKFLEEEKAKGCSHKDALLAWSNSDVKAKLLSAMPYAEKKRRRFV